MRRGQDWICQCPYYIFVRYKNLWRPYGPELHCHRVKVQSVLGAKVSILPRPYRYSLLRRVWCCIWWNIKFQSKLTFKIHMRIDKKGCQRGISWLISVAQCLFRVICAKTMGFFNRVCRSVFDFWQCDIKQKSFDANHFNYHTLMGPRSCICLKTNIVSILLPSFSNWNIHTEIARPNGNFV